MRPLLRPESLRPEHDVTEFDCCLDAQTTWLRRHALQAQRSDSARVYVVCRSGTGRVVGYYALAAGSVADVSASPRVATGVGRYPIRLVVLTRLGVDLAEQGHGLGLSLTRDALLQTAAVAERVGVRALLINAETPQAASFYRRVSPAFEESPTDPLHLILLMKDLRAAIRDVAKMTHGRPERRCDAPNVSARASVAAVAKASNRVKMILNDEPALKLQRLAKRTRTEPDPRGVTALLDRIDGAWEGALAGLHEARSGLGIPLEDL